MTRALKIGVILPDTEREMAGSTARWRDLAAMAKLAEEIGCDSVWVTDHLLFRFPEREEQGLWECWSLLAALAAVTERVEIGPLVSCTAFRNPALLAKIADTVDEISGGRLILGLGAGWHEPEFTAWGFPYDHRVGRFEEALTIIHGLLRNGHVDFEGTYYQARDCELRPRGPRKSGPPILIGSTSERMLGLIARYADHWNSWGRNRPDEIPELRAKVDTACVAAGRDPSTLTRSVSVLLDLPGRAGRPREKSIPLSGSNEEVAATLRAFADEGIDHLQIVVDPNNLKGLEAFGRVLELV
jgi:alkanesulfonate monooxygenase SsuD/methylene tetrahydromethanopterin reductase-like flavin-dependent oxidoreductase (luciferase family)